MGSQPIKTQQEFESLQIKRDDFILPALEAIMRVETATAAPPVVAAGYSSSGTNQLQLLPLGNVEDQPSHGPSGRQPLSQGTNTCVQDCVAPPGRPQHRHSHHHSQQPAVSLADHNTVTHTSTTTACCVPGRPQHHHSHHHSQQHAVTLTDHSNVTHTIITTACCVPGRP